MTSIDSSVLSDQSSRDRSGCALTGNPATTSTWPLQAEAVAQTPTRRGSLWAEHMARIRRGRGWARNAKMSHVSRPASAKSGPERRAALSRVVCSAQLRRFVRQPQPGAVVPSPGHGLGRALPILSHGHRRASSDSLSSRGNGGSWLLVADHHARQRPQRALRSKRCNKACNKIGKFSLTQPRLK
jgi:hypothetical protein